MEEAPAALLGVEVRTWFLSIECNLLRGSWEWTTRLSFLWKSIHLSRSVQPCSASVCVTALRAHGLSARITSNYDLNERFPVFIPATRRA